MLTNKARSYPGTHLFRLLYIPRISSFVVSRYSFHLKKCCRLLRRRWEDPLLEELAQLPLCILQKETIKVIRNVGPQHRHKQSFDFCCNAVQHKYHALAITYELSHSL